ncbi:MAG: T9SS type A sorting domain-containing protein [Bacteroidota bacterium]
MKQFLFFLLPVLLLSMTLQAQITQSAISNLGGELSSVELSLIHNMGDVVGTHMGSDPELIQGFVQFFNCDNCGKQLVDGLEDAYLHPEVRLYPNPTDGHFQLEGPASHLFRYEIWNVQAQIMQKDQLPQGVIDQSNLPAGVYLIHTYGQDGRLTAILKLFKQ